jgi:hypothetical protein
MRGACLGVLAICAAASPALAASMEPRFGNTMIGTRPDGMVMKMYYNEDHTFTGEITPMGAPMAIRVSGTWKLDGDKLCVLPQGGSESCAELKGDHVGDKWETTVRDVNGEPVVQQVEIVKGR